MAASLYRGRDDNPIRREVVSALQEQQPIVHEVLSDHVQAATSKSPHAVGVTIGVMLKRGEIIQTSSGYRLAMPRVEKNEAVSNGGASHTMQNAPRRAAQSNPETETADIAAYYKERKGQTITIESSPIELEEVIQLSLKMGEARYMPIPLFTPVRVVYGELARIHPAQEVYRGASAIRVLTRDGRVHEYQIDPAKDVVMVAPSAAQPSFYELV